jgi:hypothetical protein
VTDIQALDDRPIEHLHEADAAMTAELAEREARFRHLAADYETWHADGDATSRTDYRSSYQLLRDQYDLSKELRALARRRRRLALLIATREATDFEVAQIEVLPAPPPARVPVRRILAAVAFGLLPVLLIGALLADVTAKPGEKVPPNGPIETTTVTRAGKIPVDFTTTTCGARRNAAALFSVEGDRNVKPRPPG